MLKQRILSAVFIVLPIIAALILAPQPWSSLLGFVLYAFAAWEWSGFVPGTTLAQRRLLTACYCVVLALVYVCVNYTSYSLWLFGLAIVWWLIATVNVLRYPFVLNKAFIIISGMLVLIPAYAAICVAESFGNGAYGSELLWIFLLVWAADIGAYFVGRQFGSHKLAPSVSPGKTWEGLIGGVVAALLMASAIAWYAQISLLKFLLLSVLIVLVSVIGDLTVSLYKRNAKVKDAGKLFPGHGGVLDRFDSFSAAAPVMQGVILGGALHGFLVL